ncbi:hypothetical protein IV73_GL000743 [Weissella kandleri]|uniref:Thioredoxin domain-containing protein n=1 Tax=Weissella kandleri TaxID=1616 RepID=A0A0R2JCG1_9LACO|nr:thioredoxin family protein [Weissella kandleri]KRN74987.1 hypothetical protein IV73_GL000743 [Weissella kandleri]
MEFYKPVIISDHELNAQIKTDGKQIMFMSAEWCGDCKAIKPFIQVLKKYAEDAGINWFDADRDTNMAVAEEQDIWGIPVFVAFVDGVQVDHLGDGQRLAPKEVTDFIDKLINW